MRALLAAAALAACSQPDATPRAPDEGRPDVLLVVFDTLRADHSTVYGYDRDTTPNLERLARRGVSFDVAYAPAGTTSVSHATLFTAKQPIAHGVVRNGLALSEDERTLAERLRDEGYQTAAFVSSFPVSRRFGFAQGFDHFDDDFSLESSSNGFRVWADVDVPAGFDRPPVATTEAALAWLRAAGERAPLFLWVHYFDPHSPNEAPPAYADRFPARGSGALSRVIAAYDAEVSYADAEMGRLADAFLARSSERGALVVITSDHGEGLWDHGERFHDRHTFEEEVRIPLVLLWPGRLPEGVRIAQPAGLIDVVPTVTHLLGIGPPSGDGLDLVPYIDGDTPPDRNREIFLQRSYHPEGRFQHHERGHGFGLRVGRWKYYEAPEEGVRRLFDLESDPGERSNLAAVRPGLARRLSRRIADWRAAQERQYPPRELEVPAGAIEGLRALGYLDGDEEAPAPPE